MKTLTVLVVAGLLMVGCGGGSSGSTTAQVDLPLDDVNWDQVIDDIPKPIEWCLEQDKYGNWWKQPCD